MTAAELVASKKHVLLDFDGPICAAFAGYGAANISRQLATLMAMEGVNVPPALVDGPDPFEFLRFSATLEDPDLLVSVNAEFRRLEIEAVKLAPPTPYAVDVIHVLADRGLTISIVSNNSLSAVHAYIDRQHLRGIIAGVSARSEPDPDLLKPNPHFIWASILDLSARADECVMVGDSASDIEAAMQVPCTSIAFANKPCKESTFAALRPAAIIRSMRQLVYPDHQ